MQGGFGRSGTQIEICKGRRQLRSKAKRRRKANKRGQTAIQQNPLILLTIEKADTQMYCSANY